MLVTSESEIADCDSYYEYDDDYDGGLNADTTTNTILLAMLLAMAV